MSHVMRKPILQYANNKGADQPAHPCSLISAFVVCCLDNIISLLAISEISSLYLASVSEQACLSLTWSQTPKSGFLVTRLKFSLVFSQTGIGIQFRASQTALEYHLWDALLYGKSTLFKLLGDYIKYFGCLTF